MSGRVSRPRRAIVQVLADLGDACGAADGDDKGLGGVGAAVAHGQEERRFGAEVGVAGRLGARGGRDDP
jgi:hypothetical protein